MESWLENFVETCKEMRQKDLTALVLSERGKIEYQKDQEHKCSKCDHPGIFCGDELEYGEFYECGTAKYCPECDTVYKIITGCNFAIDQQKKFLPIMKQKLISHPEFSSKVYKKGSCPECKNPTYNLFKDLGFREFYDNTWTVCINKSCNWPGDHNEVFERSEC